MPRANKLIGLALGLLVTLLAVALRVNDPPLMATLRGAGFDTLQTMWPRSGKPAQPVRVIDIDEASLKSIGQWPWPRDELAKLVTNLNELGAAAITFDIVFAEPDRMSSANDVALAQAIKAAPVVTAFASSSNGQSSPSLSKASFAQIGLATFGAPLQLSKVTSNLAMLDQGASGLGSMNIDLAGDQGVARQVPLLWSDGKNLYPSLILESLRVAQQANTYVINGSANSENTIESIRVGDIEIPTSEDGFLQLNYRKDSPALYVSAAKILRSTDLENLRPLIEGHIVLIGTSAVGLLDTRTSALGESIPGVSIHAQAIEQIMGGQFLTRPDSVGGSEIAITILFGILIALAANYLRPMQTIFVGAATLASLAAISTIAFRNYGLLFDFTFPAAALLLTFVTTTAFKLMVTDRQGRHLRRSFAHYVAPSILAEIEQNPQDLKLGGEIRDVTVMFMDIKNFTPLSEKLEPQELVKIINGVLEAASKAILAEGGTIDKFIGDAVMAFWNAPVATPEHQYHALKAALKIQQNIATYNEGDAVKPVLQAIESWPIAVRIGVASGAACIGNMGSEQRFNYTVIGAAVNTAARAESACKQLGYDIILAGPLLGKSTELTSIAAGTVAMKGLSKEIEVHAIVGY